MPDSQKITPAQKLAEIKKVNNQKQAIALIKKLVEQYPEFTPARVELGLVHRRQGDRHLALATFKSGVKFAPQNANLRLKLVEEQLQCDRLSEAQQNIDWLLASNPNHVLAIIQGGLIKSKQNNYQEACDWFGKALKLDPKSVWGNIYLAQALQSRDNFAAAEQQLKQALEVVSDSYLILMQLGYLERKRNNRQAALNWFETARERAANKPRKINAQLYAIEDLGAIGEIDKAIASIEALLIESPQNIRAKLIYGNLLQQQLQFDNAIATYQEIIAAAPQNIRAYLELASCWQAIHQTKEALAVLEKINKSVPDNLEVLTKIGAIYRQQQEHTKAIACYQKILQLQPHNLAAKFDLAKAFQESNRLAAASQEIEAILANHPRNFRALMQLARIEQQRKPEIALEHFQKAIDTHPQRIEPHLGKTDILLDLDRLAEAQTYLNDLYRQYPEEFAVIINLGRCAKRMGQRQQAWQWFDKAQTQAKNSTQTIRARLFAIEELRDLGRYDEALTTVEELIAQHPENTRALLLKGSILQRIPSLNKAIAVYELVLSLQPSNLLCRFELAKAYSQSDRVEKAIDLLETTHHTWGANFEILSQLGNLHQALENWTEARQWYLELCQQFPDRPQGYCLFANLIYLQGEVETALMVLEEADRKIPNSFPILLQTIDILIRSGDLPASQKLLKQAIALFPDRLPLRLKLCRCHMQGGEYEQALEVLAAITTDDRAWLKQIEEHRGNIYFSQYQYARAEKHFQKAIAIAPIAIGTRNRLANILLLTGRLQEARQEFKTATDELQRRTPPGKIFVPLRSHPAMVANELRINPPMLAKLQAAQQQASPQDRIMEFGRMLVEEPTYLGASLYLARELRQQGIFDKLQQTLATDNRDFPSIPRRIVQYWDESNPPQEVKNLCQSWQQCNPDYEYHLFDYERAIAFLETHYDREVLNSFANCDRPATQADFFRLAYLNKMGGFYADADDLCRQSLDAIVRLKPELVVLQEDFACIGNNFIGCIPGQISIRTAFYQAVNNLAEYCNEAPWFKTGPGMLTSAIGSGLVPYLTYTDYRMWLRLLVLSQTQFRKLINQHIFLSYKKTNKSWQYHAYSRRLANSPYTRSNRST